MSVRARSCHSCLLSPRIVKSVLTIVAVSIAIAIYYIIIFARLRDAARTCGERVRPSGPPFAPPALLRPLGSQSPGSLPPPTPGFPTHGDWGQHSRFIASIVVVYPRFRFKQTFHHIYLLFRVCRRLGVAPFMSSVGWHDNFRKKHLHRCRYRRGGSRPT